MHPKVKKIIGPPILLAVKVIIAAYFLTAAWIPYLYRILFGTVWGVFLLALGAYHFSPHLFGITPLSFPGGLINWFANLPVGGRTAVTTAVLTTIGFMAAFWSSYAAWQHQTAVSARASAAGAVADQLMNAIHATAGLRSYLSMLQTTATAAIAAPQDSLAVNNLQYVLWKTQEFLQARDLLQTSQLALTELPTRHSNVFTNTFGLTERIHRGAAYFQNALQKCFGVQLPAVSPGIPNSISDFLAHLNFPAVNNAIIACDVANNNGGLLLGFVQGQLRYSIYPPTIWGMIKLTRNLPKHIGNFSTLFPGRSKGAKA